MSKSSRPPPIAILSFDRPAYLADVLRSLRAQHGGRLDDREIVLFQDGAVNPISGIHRAAAADIEASVRVFRDLLPGRRVLESPINLGVALNFDRAERAMFEDLGAEAAVFLEDDMVLATLYLRALDRLLELTRHDERIGVVAAYGPYTRSLAVQRRDPAGYVAMDHNWAFGLTRTQWLRNAPFVEEYLALIRHVDYPDRPHHEVRKLYERWGFGFPGSSQDVTKGLACVATGAIRVNTGIVLGRYIGALGQHMNPEIFARHNYEATELYDGALPDFTRPAASDYDLILQSQKAWARTFAPGFADPVSATGLP